MNGTGPGALGEGDVAKHRGRPGVSGSLERRGGVWELGRVCTLRVEAAERQATSFSPQGEKRRGSDRSLCGALGGLREPERVAREQHGAERTATWIQVDAAGSGGRQDGLTGVT